MGLHCLPLTHKKDARLIWVKLLTFFIQVDTRQTLKMTYSSNLDKTSKMQISLGISPIGSSLTSEAIFLRFDSGHTGQKPWLFCVLLVLSEAQANMLYYTFYSLCAIAL